MSRKSHNKGANNFKPAVANNKDGAINTFAYELTVSIYKYCSIATLRYFTL